jgi:hypothetical protein
MDVGNPYLIAVASRAAPDPHGEPQKNSTSAPSRTWSFGSVAALGVGSNPRDAKTSESSVLATSET